MGGTRRGTLAEVKCRDNATKTGKPDFWCEFYRLPRECAATAPVQGEMTLVEVNKEKRFGEFIERVAAAPPAASREEALQLLKSVMDAVENEHVGADAPFDHKMHVYGWEFQWRNLDSDPCHWDDSWSKKHRTHLYHSGRIVIRRMRAPLKDVLVKPGLGEEGGAFVDLSVEEPAEAPVPERETMPENEVHMTAMPYQVSQTPTASRHLWPLTILLLVLVLALPPVERLWWANDLSSYPRVLLSAPPAGAVDLTALHKACGDPLEIAPAPNGQAWARCGLWWPLASVWEVPRSYVAPSLD